MWHLAIFIKLCTQHFFSVLYNPYQITRAALKKEKKKREEKKSNDSEKKKVMFKLEPTTCLKSCVITDMKLK